MRYALTAAHCSLCLKVSNRLGRPSSTTRRVLWMHTRANATRLGFLLRPLFPRRRPATSHRTCFPQNFPTSTCRHHRHHSLPGGRAYALERRHHTHFRTSLETRAMIAAPNTTLLRRSVDGLTTRNLRSNLIDPLERPLSDIAHRLCLRVLRSLHRLLFGTTLTLAYYPLVSR